MIKYFLENIGKYLEYFRIVSCSRFFFFSFFFSINTLAISIRFTIHRLGIPVLEAQYVGECVEFFSVVISINTTRQMTNSTIIYYNLTFVYRKVIRP